VVASYAAMLASPWPEPFDDADWWFEVKWDGFRVLVEWDGALTLRSRRGNDFTESFPELAAVSFERPTVLDGELVAFGDDGRPEFTRLLERNGVAGAHARDLARSRPVTLVGFDLLHDGEPLIDLPMEARWERLDALPRLGWTRSDPIREKGVALFDAISDRGLEGIVAKRSGSRYRPGVRSGDWRKIANRRFAHAVVVGFSPGERSRSESFGALQLAMYEEDGSLRYVGGVGSGLDDRSLGAIRAALDQMRRSSAPLPDPRPLPQGTAWVEPRLVALVEFKEWTPGGRLRAPVFKGFVDLDPAAVTWEAEGP
jgi:bifunctional non-homologous end joining protein LigD